MELPDSAKSELEKLVGELEANSSAEVVMAVAGQSGAYRDLELVIPVLLSWCTIGFLVISPFVFPDWSLVPSVLLAFALGLGLARLPAVRGSIPRLRRRRQVQDAARAAFFREHVSATKDRTGLFVYLSLREGEVEILADYGVQAVVPDAHWNEILEIVRRAPRATRCQALLQALRPSAVLLAERLPRSADDRDELSNAPRMLT